LAAIRALKPDPMFPTVDDKKQFVVYARLLARPPAGQKYKLAQIFNG
jgi:hypothetical protein